MRTWWKVLIGLVVALPMLAYVAGTLAATGDEPAPREPVVLGVGPSRAAVGEPEQHAHEDAESRPRHRRALPTTTMTTTTGRRRSRRAPTTSTTTMTTRVAMTMTTTTGAAAGAVTTTEPTTTEPTPPTDSARPHRPGVSVRVRITATVALLVALALAGAGLIIHTIESAQAGGRRGRPGRPGGRRVPPAPGAGHRPRDRPAVRQHRAPAPRVPGAQRAQRQRAVRRLGRQPGEVPVQLPAQRADPRPRPAPGDPREPRLRPFRAHRLGGRRAAGRHAARRGPGGGRRPGGGHLPRRRAGRAQQPAADLRDRLAALAGRDHRDRGLAVRQAAGAAAQPQRHGARDQRHRPVPPAAGDRQRRHHRADPHVQRDARPAGGGVHRPAPVPRRRRPRAQDTPDRARRAPRAARRPEPRRGRVHPGPARRRGRPDVAARR